MAAILKLSENQTSEHGTIFSIFGHSDFGVPLYYSRHSVNGHSVTGTIQLMDIYLSGN